jgi:hypothetical protein
VSRLSIWSRAPVGGVGRRLNIRGVGEADPQAAGGAPRDVAPGVRLDSAPPMGRQGSTCKGGRVRDILM